LCKRLAITQATAITWEKKGTIPALRIGDCIRYNWPEVLKALEYKKGRKND
jgi:predicted site-specific integrase-resolvase